MNTKTPSQKKKSGKQDRAHKVLLGLVDYYIKTGKPVGSNTLKDAEFADLSSATIRNYFSELEKKGYLVQQHASGGRIPTDLAYQVYAQEYLESPTQTRQSPQVAELLNSDQKEIAAFLQRVAEKLATLSSCAVFLSAPKFDHDYVSSIRIAPIDSTRCLCILITDFGAIHTEIMLSDEKITAFSIKRLESYFHWKLTGLDRPENLDSDEEFLAQKFYKELMLRYIVNYSCFTDYDLYRTGFSSLLSYPEFHNPAVLSNSLALFENVHGIRLLLRECIKHNSLKFWLGNDLISYTKEKPECSVLAIPYQINQQVAGAIGILGPSRMPYRELFTLLREFSEIISGNLTRNVHKFKINIRKPDPGNVDKLQGDRLQLEHSHYLLIEDQS